MVYIRVYAYHSVIQVVQSHPVHQRHHIPLFLASLSVTTSRLKQSLSDVHAKSFDTSR